MDDDIYEYLLKEHGLTMRLKRVAGLLQISEQALRNRVSLGTSPVHSWKEGGIRLFSTRAIADYLFEKDEKAKIELQKIKKKLNQ